MESPLVWAGRLNAPFRAGSLSKPLAREDCSSSSTEVKNPYPNQSACPTVPDGHLAALMRQHGVGKIYTRDRDFRRFDGIAAEDPFSDAR